MVFSKVDDQTVSSYHFAYEIFPKGQLLIRFLSSAKFYFQIKVTFVVTEN